MTMERRGRPKHPDILTPREWEVLALIREELSNEEIAGRLGISIDGVKYHVSEILSKLELENRADAARWQPGDQPWWLAAAAPLLFLRKIGFGWLSPVVAGGVAVVVVAGAGLLIWALVATGGGGGASRTDLSALTPENFGDRLLEALTREGKVFHTNIAQFSVTADGTRQDMYTVEAWLDLEHELVREEFHKDPTFEADLGEYQVSLVVGDTLYSGDEEEILRVNLVVGDTLFPGDEEEILRGKNNDCSIMGPWLSASLTLVFNCEPLSEDVNLSPRRVETDVEYRGTRAIAVSRDGIAESEGSSGIDVTEFTVSFYVDRETFLPLAQVTEIRSSTEGSEGELVAAFENEFLSRDSLPDDLFDPASIGYVAPTPTNTNPAVALDQPGLGVTVYWLGREFAGEGGLPALRLASSAGPDHPGEGPGNRVSMSYKPPQGQAVEIRLWEPAEWDSFYQVVIPPGALGSSCAEQEEIQLEGGRAVIFMGYEPRVPPRTTPDTTSNNDGFLRDVTPTPASAASGCPARPFDLFMAVVSFEDTVVTVNAPHCVDCAGRGADLDPYDSRAGMEAIVRGLRLRQPGE